MSDAGDDSGEPKKPMRRVARPGAAELKEFNRLREAFRGQYAGLLATSEKFWSLGGEETIRRLRASEESHPAEKFSAAIRYRLKQFMSAPQVRTLYDLLAQEIGQQPGDRDILLADYLGDYVFFRYGVPHGDVGNAIYVKGEMRILQDDNGDPAFLHWSPDQDRAAHPDDPEHMGLVFKHESHLFFAGRRGGVMRLGIARTFDSPAKKDCIPGLVVSVRTAARDPFAARFLLVPATNPSLIAELDPNTPGAEEAFLKRMKAKPVGSYMLLI